MRSNHSAKKLRLERLEDKRPLAADFIGSVLQAEIVDGDLVITNLEQNFNIDNAPGNLDDQQLTVTGDNLGNIDILIEGAELFDPVSGSTLQPGDTLSLSGFTGGIDADFGSDLVGLPGNNTFLLRLEGGLDVGGDISVVGGADFVGLVIVGEEEFGDPAPFTIDGSISLVGNGPGTYGTAIVDGTVNGDITLDASQSDPQEEFTRGAFADFSGLTIAGDLSVDFGTTTIGSRFSAENRFTLDFSTVGGDVTFNGGDREDLVNLTGSVFDPVIIHGDLDVETQEGDDRIQINFSQFDEEPFSTETFVSVGGELRIDDGDGEDLIQLTDFAVGNLVDLRLGLGDDTVTVSNGEIETVAVPADFLLSNAGGADDIQITDFATGDDFRFDLAGDGTSVSLSGVTAPDDIRVADGSGATAIEILDGSVGDDVVLNLGDGGDELSIDVLTIGNNLRVRGGAGDDEIEVFAAEVDGETTIGAGDGDDLVVLGDGSSFAGPVSLRGGQGNDELAVFLIETTGYIELVGGADGDTLSIGDSTIGTDAFIFAGGGMNEVELSVSEIGRSAWVFTGNAEDLVAVDDLTVGDDLRIFTGGGVDTLELFNLNVADLLLIDTGAGDDTLLIEEAELNRVFVDLGRGDDSLTLDTVSADGFALFSGGRGTDDLTVTGMNDFDAAFAVWFEDIDIS